MSLEFDNKLVDFERWYNNNKKCERDINKDMRFLHDAIDKTIELIECANKDLRAYERRSELLVGTGIRV